MTLNFDWVKPLSSGRSTVANADAVFARKIKAGRKNDQGEDMHQLSLTIPQKAMEAARFVVGDRVEVGFAKDEDGFWAIAVRRVLSGGYSITSATGGAKDVKGKPVRGRIQMTLRDSMPESFCSPDGGYEIDSNGMLIAREAR